MVSSQPFARIIAAEIEGRALGIRYRQNQFHRLHSALLRHTDDLKDAVSSDSGNSAGEVQAEIWLALREVCEHYASLDLEQELKKEYRVANGEDNHDRRTAVGIVYIVPTSHTLFYSVIAAVSAALAAGNCIILELPRITMKVSSLLRKILPGALDADTFAISEERPSDSFMSKVTLVQQQHSSTEQVTQSNQVVSATTSKTVGVVDRTGSLQQAAESLVLACFSFGGGSPYSPDIVMVNENVLQPFLEAVIQYASKYFGAAYTKPDGKKQKAAPNSGSIKHLENTQDARVVVSGSDWGIVEVHDRKSSFIQNKRKEKFFIVHPTSSLDDAIEATETIRGQSPLAATYAFASPAAAKYLSQFINTHLSWINHVSYEMLIGPAIPLNAPISSKTRYSRQVFEVPRPQIVHGSANSRLVKELLDDAKVRSAEWQEMLKPLPETKQPVGKKLGFFEQGIISGSLVVIFSLITAASTAAYFGLGYARKLQG